LSVAYRVARSPEYDAKASALQALKSSITARRLAPSSTMTNRHGWLMPTDGDRQAISMSRSSAPSGSGSVRKCRTSRRQMKSSRN
jgi:hypothetical protein